MYKATVSYIIIIGVLHLFTAIVCSYSSKCNGFKIQPYDITFTVLPVYLFEDSSVHQEVQQCQNKLVLVLPVAVVSLYVERWWETTTLKVMIPVPV